MEIREVVTVRNVLFRGGVLVYSHCSSAVNRPGSRHAPSQLERSFRHQCRRALSAKASADGARPAAAQPGIKVTSTSCLGLGREPAQKGALGCGELGREALERAKHREKGRAAFSNPESSSCYANGQSPAPLLLPQRARGTRSDSAPPVRHICPGRDKPPPADFLCGHRSLEQPRTRRGTAWPSAIPSPLTFSSGYKIYAPVAHYQKAPGFS